MEKNIYVNTYDRPEDIPPYEDKNDGFVRLINETVTYKTPIGVLKNNVGYAIKWRELILPKNLIPAPEREYLEPLDDFIHIQIPIIRPTFDLTREDINTISGRTKLFRWMASSESNITDMVNYLSIVTEKGMDMWRYVAEKMWLTFPREIDKNGKMVDVYGNSLQVDNVSLAAAIPLDQIFVKPIKHEWDGGLIENNGMWSDAPFQPRYNQDLILSYIVQRDIKNRDDLQQVASQYLSKQFVQNVLAQYDQTQLWLDGMWATFQLFRTEDFATIVDCQKWQQQVALQNYFATWRKFRIRNKKKKLTTEIDESATIADNANKFIDIMADEPVSYEILNYNATNYVVTNVFRNILHAPEEMRRFANGAKITIAPKRKESIKPGIVIIDKATPANTPREPNVEILNHLVVKPVNDIFSALYGTDRDRKSLKKVFSTTKFTEQQIRDICTPRAEMQKFQYYMMEQIQKSPEFNPIEWAKQVHNALRADNPDIELLKLSNKFATIIDLKDCAEYIYITSSGKHLLADHISGVATMLFNSEGKPFILSNQKTKAVKIFSERNFTPVASGASFTFRQPDNPDAVVDLAPNENGVWEIQRKQYVDENGLEHYSSIKSLNLKVNVLFNPLLFYHFDEPFVPRTEIMSKHIQQFDKDDGISFGTIRALEACKILTGKRAKHELLVNHAGKKGEFSDDELRIKYKSKEKTIIGIADFTDLALCNSGMNIALPVENATILARYRSRIEKELSKLVADGIHMREFVRDGKSKNYIFYWKQQPLQLKQPDGSTSAK